MYEKLKEEFKAILPYANFITPLVVDYVERGSYICEISKEKCPTSMCLVVVTVVDRLAKKRCVNLDKPFLG